MLNLMGVGTFRIDPFLPKIIFSECVHLYFFNHVLFTKDMKHSEWRRILVNVLASEEAQTKEISSRNLLKNSKFQANETFWIIIIAFTVRFLRIWARIPITWTYPRSIDKQKGEYLRYIGKGGSKILHDKTERDAVKEDSVYGWWSAELSSGREIRH